MLMVTDGKLLKEIRGVHLRGRYSLMKHDILMWAKDGAPYLPITLKRIDEALPHEVVNRKIFVNDHSSDNSPEIAKSFNWEVYDSPERGIGHGAALALSKVTTERFISFEQDVLINRKWFDHVSRLIEDPQVAVVQGWRIGTDRTIRDLDTISISFFGEKLCSIDNNIFKTKIVRQVGGFPKDVFYFVDAVLRYRIVKAGYKWICDTSVVSEHLKPFGYQKEARRMYNMSLEHPKLIELGILGGEDGRKLRRGNLVFATLRAPIIGSMMALYRRNPYILPYYVLIKYGRLKANLVSKNKNKASNSLKGA